ncbi:MAG: DUF1667 domain-containing protein [Eubacteriales bacterium]|nr:DUF1667 domain-containing protein [Eubacteriales bacterium]
MEIKNLTCIGCPMGCSLKVTMGLENIFVEGNICPRGDAYARKEVTNPTRVVTSTVRVTGSRTGAAAVPCKTAGDIPKDRIFAVMEDIAGVSVLAPVHIGEVVKANVAGTGVDMIATKEIV